jgi:hypothetical protein
MLSVDADAGHEHRHNLEATNILQTAAIAPNGKISRRLAISCGFAL